MTHLFLQLHTDRISLFEEDGVAPKLIPERGELVETPLPERPQSQLGLSHRPRHWRAGQMICEHILAKQKPDLETVCQCQNHLPLQAPLLPRETPGTESPLVSEELPVYSRSPKRNHPDQNKCVRTGTLNGKILYRCFRSPAAAALAGYWLLLFLCGTDLQAPEA